jgi:predicted AlkP superfamily phosphohydrolase/phosphomutase
MPSDPSSRLFVFGWDSADWAVIEAGWREGRLQNLRAIVDRGQSGTAMSTIPPITPLAFTSFLTGADPGEHGIFGFVTRGEGYEYLPVPGGARKVPTLIRRLDQAGYRTALVTFPYTYPAEPLEHGIVVPGWDDPEETFDSVHPPEVGRALAEVVPKIPRRVNIRAAIPVLFAKMNEGAELKQRIARWVIDRLDPHVFAMVFSETDHASHRFWVEGDPPRELIDVYELVDTTMGRVMKDVVREEDTVLVVSDHGSWPVHHLVHIAPMLAEGGFLTRARAAGMDAKKRVDASDVLMGRGVGTRDKRRSSFFARMDWANTQAFPLGDSVIATGIYVNSPPLPIPAVAPDEYEDVRTAVTAYLSKIEDPGTGQPVFSTVARREDVYHGAAVSLAPDVIVDGVDGYSLQLGRILDFKALFTRVARGGHRREGMYAVNGALGLDAVEPIEGLLPKVLSALSFEVAERGDAESGLSEGYTEEQAREIERRLQGLGYME